MMTLFILISFILFEDSHARLSCYYPSDCFKNCSENSVCATIQKGQELILTYNLAPNNLNWITCTWSRYELFSFPNNFIKVYSPEQFRW